jgi:ribonuclease HII
MQQELFPLDELGIETVVKSVAAAQPSEFEKFFYSTPLQRLAGVDEAGRGPLAGPVVAAACVLPQGALFEGLTDSKLLSSDEIHRLYREITSHPNVDFEVGIVDADEIDRIDILQATLLAMRHAIYSLKVLPDFVVIDGNRSLQIPIPNAAVIKGDRYIRSISAASVIAKYTRDELMKVYDQRWPEYGFAEHKGYGTPLHIQKLKEFGPCPIHRKSFAPVIQELIPSQLSLL